MSKTDEKKIVRVHFIVKVRDRIVSEFLLSKGATNVGEGMGYKLMRHIDLPFGVGKVAIRKAIRETIARREADNFPTIWVFDRVASMEHIRTA